MTLRLYAFQPKGHGPKSYFVMAENEDEARAFVSAVVADADGYDSDGWKTGGYTVTVAEPGDVIVNDND